MRLIIAVLFSIVCSGCSTYLVEIPEISGTVTASGVPADGAELFFPRYDHTFKNVRSICKNEAEIKAVVKNNGEFIIPVERSTSRYHKPLYHELIIRQFNLCIKYRNNYFLGLFSGYFPYEENKSQKLMCDINNPMPSRGIDGIDRIVFCKEIKEKS